jgi:hypothetical protein
MTAIVERSSRSDPSSPAQRDAQPADPRNRFAARRVAAAARADVSVQESQALSRAAAEAPHQLRRLLPT